MVKTRPVLVLFIVLAAIATVTRGWAQAQSDTQTTTVDTAIFAGGCFWCVESDFDKVPGVLSTTSGYTGGTTQNPTYKNHTQGRHREVVAIEFDPSQVSYEQLVEIFWRTVDPTDDGGQFCDRGFSYTTAIYALNDEQKLIAERSKMALAKNASLNANIVTPIVAASEFWPAEDYHQDYYLKNPIRYKYYRTACRRDKRVKNIWGGEAHKGLEK